jgi:hypothetical protein
MYVYTYITCCIRYAPAPSSTRDDVRFVRFENRYPIGIRTNDGDGKSSVRITVPRAVARGLRPPWQSNTGGSSDSETQR